MSNFDFESGFLGFSAACLGFAVLGTYHSIENFYIYFLCIMGMISLVFALWFSYTKRREDKMNNRGQVSPVGFLMGILGAGIGWYMAGAMGAGLGLKIFTVGLTAIVCYAIGWKIAEE